MSVNKVILMGHLGRDPEVRYMPNGEAVANFSIATSEQWKDKNGQRQDRTEWHNITLYRRQAEIAGQYLKKGQPVYIEGKIQSRKYTDKSGVERVAYDIIGNELKLIGVKNDSGHEPQSSQQSHQAPSSAPAAPRRETRAPVRPVDDLDDDIPF